jgi:hypothetical protein
VIPPDKYFHETYLIVVVEFLAKGSLPLSMKELFQKTYFPPDPKVLNFVSSLEQVENIL